MKTQLFGMIAIVTSVGALAACKDDPPPPPPTATTAAQSANVKSKPPSDRDRTRVPRISPETMKQYRVETCYFGSMGLKVAGDAYLESMGDGPPSATNLPDFGEYPENAPRGGDKGDEDKGEKEGQARREGRRPVGGGRSLPFIRHVRACSIAKSLKQPAYPELDQAIGEFEGYVSDLQRLFLDASRYYAREQFKNDDFKRAKTIDEKLKAELPKLDAQIDKLTKAMEAWWPEMKAGDEKLDEAGKLSDEAMKEARAAVRNVLSAQTDAEALKTSTTALQDKLTKLEGMLEKDNSAPHPRVVVPRLKELIAALEAVQQAQGELTSDQLYPVTSAMASLIEAHQRGIAQLLRQSAMGSGKPLRMRPRLRDHSIRMPRPTMSGRPKVAPPAPDAK